MRTFAVIAIALACGGCFHDPEVEICRDIVRGLATSPSSIRYVDTKAYTDDAGKDVFMDFDAGNAFGAALRNSIRCRFTLEGYEGRFVTSRVFSDKPAVTLNGRELTDLEISSSSLIGRFTD